jgi:glycerophosphoryl diester phosphodiesterase
MRFNLLFIVFVILVSCKKETQTSTKIYGHAGFGLNSSTSVYNENTKESIQLCIETVGTVGVEIDIQFSLDGSAWCFHDVTLDDETTSTGFISEKTDAELSSLEYKNGNLKLCRLTQIPTDLWGKEIVFDLREATKEGGVYFRMSNAISNDFNCNYCKY